ncbi:MAG: dynamin family protein [Rhodomicrobium sp.]
MLKDILGASSASEPVVTPHGSVSDQPSLSYKLNVGARLEDAKRHVLESAARLITLADEETGRTISITAKQLQQQVCRVAFVGQVKAGKSSLINVLVEQPDLLPADINPCTAVITRLNFGVPGKPQSGALLTFFTREEWRRLSLGGRTRELTERLFPNFNWEVLRSQVMAMEQRAREKLGGRLEDLLGEEHLYEKSGPHLLVQYVGAGHPKAESPSERAEGEFSDITKSADIFLDLGAFSFPTIVIDTPGVNDPFLVRDEITRHNLEAADICVVVVTARHPLSATDLNLLRMLRGLKKDGIIIFVNKVDELSGGEEVLQKLTRRVSSILRQEFPSAGIPVVFGSAALALKALNRTVDGSPSSGSPDAGFEDEGAIGFQWPCQGEIASKAEAEALFLSSGVSSLAAAISEMMSVGSMAGAINAATRLIESVSANLITWLEVEADLLGRVSVEAARAEQELGSISDLRNGLAAKFNVFSKRLDALHTQEVSLVKQSLVSTAQAFIAEALTSDRGDDIVSQANQIDGKLRMRIETAFLDAIEKLRNLLENEQELLRLDLSKLLDASGLTGKPSIILGQPLALTPSLAALSEPAVLGVGAQLNGLTADLVMADFSPIIEKLASEASRVFHEGSSTFAEQAKALTFGPIDAVIERVSLALKEAPTRQPRDAKMCIEGLHKTISNLKQILEERQATVPAEA